MAFLLNIPMTVDGRVYEFQIRRLVYHCFVEPIELDNPHIMVVSKNGNGLDVKPSNLVILDRSEHTAWILERKRRISTFSKKHWQMGVAASVKKMAREVSQYNETGRRLQTFPSIMEASRQTGVAPSRISSALVGRDARGGAYYWKYGRERHLDVERLWQERRAGYQVRTKPVKQYSLKGKLLAEFPSLKEAGATLGVHPTGISANLRGITGTAYGYKWKWKVR
jgi:hypothetical protein